MMLRRRVLVALSAAALAVACVAFAVPGGADASGSVSGKITLTNDGGEPKSDMSGVIVYLEGVPGDPPAAKTNEIRQKDLTFVPDRMVVVKGSSVEFPNDDKVFHNVFSLSKAKRFDLGLYKSGTSKGVTFNKAGVIDVYCNIHPQMAAKILVVDNKSYAVTAADGSFKIPNVPAGTYPVVAWQPYGNAWRGQVTVQPGKAVTVAATVVAGAKPQSHTRKDGTPYGRYK
jgi:plastocyanin